MSDNTRKVSARVLEVVAFLADGDMEDMRDVAKLLAERAPARAFEFGLIIARTPALWPHPAKAARKLPATKRRRSLIAYSPNCARLC